MELKAAIDLIQSLLIDANIESDLQALQLGEMSHGAVFQAGSASAYQLVLSVLSDINNG